MNKTFKVVFNRARGALMVANEITSSVQKKGTKTAVAAAVASALFCAMSGATYADSDYYHKVWNGAASDVPTTITLASENGIYSDCEALALTEGLNFELLHVASGATGAVENLSVTAKITVSPSEGAVTNFDVIGLGIQNEAAADATTFPAFSGDSLTVTLESENTGDTSAIHYHGYHGDGNKVNQANITAKQLNLSVTATKDNSGGVGGIETNEGASKITSNNVNIVLKTPTTNTTAIGMGIACDPGIEAVPETKAGSSLTIDIDSAKAIGIGVYLEKDESVANSTFGYENTTIKLNQNTSRKANGTAIAVGVASDGGTWEGNGAAAINFAGNLDIDANSETNNVFGIALASAKYFGLSESTEAITESRTVTVEGNTDITLTSTSAKAYGVCINGLSAGKVDLKGDVNINNTAKTGAFGVYVLNGGTVAINNLTANVTATGSGNAHGAYLSKAGTASINNMTATVHSKGKKNANGVYLSSFGAATVGNLTANVSSENGYAYGAYLSNESTNATSLNLTGNISITATSTNNGAKGVALTTANTTATIGENGKIVTISVTGQGNTAAISANKGGVATVKGKTITLNSNYDGVRSQSSTVNLGTADTELITINIKTESEESSGIISQESGANIMVLAKELDVTTSEGFGILAQNNTQDVTAPNNAATLIINAEKTTITNTATDGNGISAFSNGQLTVNSNLAVSASNALDVRGNSTVNINTDGNHTTKLTGDIVFETPWTTTDSNGSGKLINANVNLVLSGSDSSWKGRSYKEYAGSTYVDLSSAENYGTVTGFNLTIADGASWELAGDSFVNTLTLKDGGKIDASKATTFNVGKLDSATENVVSNFKVSGTDNELTLGSETTLNGAITMAEDSELITPLATAYKGVTLSDDEEKLATIGSDFGTRLTFSADSADSATLTINDVFTYTTDVLSKLTEVYKAVTVELANASLKLTPSQEGKVTEILVDLTTKSITGGTDLQLSDGKTLTVSGGADAGESSVGEVSLGSDDSSSVIGATLKTTAETTVTAKTISGNGSGTVAVAEKSTLNVGTVKDVARVDVASGSTIDAQKISGAVEILLSDASSLKATEIESKGAVDLSKGSTIEVGTLSKGTASIDDVAVTLTEGSKLLAEVITGVDSVSLGKDTILTLGAEGVTAESSIEKIYFAAAEGEAATVNVTKAAKAQVKAIEGNGKGTLNVAEKSSLEVETLTEVAELLVSDATLKATTIDGSGEITLSKDSTLDVENLKGESKILVGDVNGEGAKLSVKNLAMTGGSIFVDPLYGHSTFHVESLGSGTLNTNITAGSGGLVVFGEATQEEVTSAVNKITALSEASAVVYVKKATKLGSMGNVVIDPNAKQAVETHQQKVLIRNGGTLVIDQAAVGNSAVFDEATALVIQNEANIGIVNAALGTINLGTTVTEEAGSTLTLYTDSPFLTASLASNGLITIAESADTDCISAVATMGIQSMIRHADAVLAETIADRIAEDKAGTGLWVAVRGERYEQDDVGSGFKADVGYGAFGADFAPTDATRLGVAVQYGHGKVKGNAYSVKNKFKDYSATLYGSAILADTGINLLGEVAYTQSKNDVSTSYHSALNQDLDAKMYSAGITTLKTFEVGNVNITPSLGVRVSRIETDAMNAGPATIAKQKQTVVQVPLAVRLSTKALETASGWSVTPRFKVAYIPTFGDKKIDVFGAKSTVLDTSPVQGAFGVSFKKGGFAADIAVQGGVGNRGTSSIGGKIGLSYQF